MSANPPVLKPGFSYTQENKGPQEPHGDILTVFKLSFAHSNTHVEEFATVNTLTHPKDDPYDHLAESLPQYFEVR